jgi:hypothetical protein
MANISGAVQIETGIKHGLSIPVQSVAVEQSIDVGTLLITRKNKHYSKAPSSLAGPFCSSPQSPLAIVSVTTITVPEMPT